MDEAAGSVIRRARQQAKLSQSELARRSGMAQSVVSAYERGRREPGLRMLTKLVNASGHRLELELVVPELPDSRLGRLVRQHRRAIVTTAARRGATNLRLFGSAARGTDSSTSDVDLLADLGPGLSLVGLAGLERELSDILGVPVDVVSESGLKPAVVQQVMAEAIPVTRRDRHRLEDVIAACEAIASHTRRGSLGEGLIFDAVRVRLIEIGEAVKDISPDLLAHEPAIPWRDVAGMPDHLTHRSFDTDHSLVTAPSDRSRPADPGRRLTLGWPEAASWVPWTMTSCSRSVASPG